MRFDAGEIQVARGEHADRFAGCTRMVGPIWPVWPTAAAAADCPPPAITTLVPLLPIALSPLITVSSMADPNRSKKCESTLPPSPDSPLNPVPGDPSATATPSGRISLVQIT